MKKFLALALVILLTVSLFAACAKDEPVDNNNDTNNAGLNSKKMATLFVNNLSSTLGTSNRGAKAERYTVVYRNTVPAVLIELGFMSNKNDFALISDPVFQENAVKVIYESILQIFDDYPTGR